MKNLFKLRGTLPTSTKLTIEVVGACCSLALWWTLNNFKVIPAGILPSPQRVFTSFADLFREGVLYHAYYSIKLNMLGYLEAVLFCLPVGLMLGLFPLFEALSERLLSATRFLPLPAAMGIFIAAFGIGTGMKVHFLAVGIAVYLLPTVVQRVRETPEVYVQTVKTLGAHRWQTIRYVFVPDLLGRVFDDIRVLVAISWTYITIAEVINSSAGGLGALAQTASRQGRVDKIYAILVIVMVIGLIQDWVFKCADRTLFPYKHA